MSEPSLRYKLKYLESLMTEEKYAGREYGLTPFDLWKMVEEGQTKAVYKLVSPKIREYLEHMRKTSLPTN